jgi:hypothetical protein
MNEEHCVLKQGKNSCAIATDTSPVDRVDAMGSVTAFASRRSGGKHYGLWWGLCLKQVTL